MFPELIRPQGPLAEQELAAVEAELGIKLPADYRSFMLKYNGGRPEPSGFDIAYISYGPIAQAIKDALVVFFLKKLAPRCSVEDVVFDVSVMVKPEPSVRLIELNPFGPPTDACLFSWESSDFDGTIRIAGPKGIITLPLRNHASDTAGAA